MGLYSAMFRHLFAIYEPFRLLEGGIMPIIENTHPSLLIESLINGGGSEILGFLREIFKPQHVRV